MTFLYRLVVAVILVGASSVLASAQERPPDSSLSVGEYTRLGIPSIDRVWSSVDYDIAARILDSIRRADVTRLPRYRSERSGDLFEWMISPANFLPDDSIVTMEVRATWMIAISQSAPKLLMVYGSGKGRALDDETAEISGHMLFFTRRLLEAVMNLLEERGMLEVLDDPNNASMKQVRQGVHGSIVGTLQILGDTTSMRAPSRRRLAGHIAAVVPTLLPFVSDDARLDILNQISAATTGKNDEAAKILAPLVSQLVSKTREETE